MANRLRAGPGRVKQQAASATGETCQEWEAAAEWVLEELGLTPECLEELTGRIGPPLARP